MFQQRTMPELTTTSIILGYYNVCSIWVLQMPYRIKGRHDH